MCARKGKSRVEGKLHFQQHFLEDYTIVLSLGEQLLELCTVKCIMRQRERGDTFPQLMRLLFIYHHYLTFFLSLSLSIIIINSLLVSARI